MKNDDELYIPVFDTGILKNKLDLACKEMNIDFEDDGNVIYIKVPIERRIITIAAFVEPQHRIKYVALVLTAVDLSVRVAMCLLLNELNLKVPLGKFVLYENEVRVEASQPTREVEAVSLEDIKTYIVNIAYNAVNYRGELFELIRGHD